jgi:hypothetical protein
MALGRIAALDPVDRERHDLAVECAEDALQRAHPAQGPRPPGHRLRPGEVADDALDHLGDDLRGRPALALDIGEPDAVTLDELLAGQARGTQEAVQRRVGRADPRALALFLAVRLGDRQPLGDQGQAPRAGEGLQRLGQEAAFGETVARHAFEIAPRLRLHARGNLF